MSATERLGAFFFDVRARPFLARFVLVLYPFCVARLWLADWRPYVELAPWLYHPTGLGRLVALPAPTAASVLLVRLAATAAALAVVAGRSYRFSAFAFLALLLTLQTWANSFGFVKSDGHLVWYAALVALCPFGRGATAHSGQARDDDGGFVACSALYRCLELVAVLAYVQSGVAKLRDGGLAWALEGTTLQIALLRQERPLGVWLAAHHRLVVAASCATLALELGFALYFFAPRLRRPLFAVALGFHLATYACLAIDFSHLWIFPASVLAFGPKALNPRPARG